MKYIAITEVSPVYIKTEANIKDLEEYVKNLSFIPLSFEKQSEPVLPNYMKIELSEETFQFINSVATIYHSRFGEKEYKINDLKFKIYTEDEYEKINL